MEMSRRNVLRSAALVGGTAAAVPLVTSLAGSAVAGVVSPAGTTLAKTYGLGPVNAAGYGKIVELAGEAHVVREDLLTTPADPDRENARSPLAAFVQFSDIHVVDHQSPGRVEWLDRFEDPNDLGLVPGLLSSSYRAWEMLSAQVADAMVQAVNDIKDSSPVTGQPLSFMIETGDNSDNCQKNEIRWNIDILDGKSVRPDSGSHSKYEGVMDKNVIYYDTHYWHPDGQPGGKQPDKLRKDHGYPTVPGLLDTARQPFTAEGLDLPWYTVFGNHDGLIQGNFPNSTTQLDLLSRGAVKVITVPPGITQSDILNSLKKLDLLGLLSSINLLPGARLVTPDPARKNLSRKEVINEYFNTTSSPVGHGYTAANKTNGTAYYYFDEGSFRHIAMDTVNPNGYADGSLDQAQFAWLKSTIASAGDKAVIVYSHHTSGSMANPLVLTGLDPSLRVLGDAVTSYLLTQPRVIAWVNGHTHRNEIIAHKRADNTGGFWEINTASHIDFPQQARVIEITDNADGTLSIFTTIIDHAGPADPGTNPTSTLALASLSRELSANDPQSNLASLSGTAASRNAELLLPVPVGVNLAQAPTLSASSINPVAVAALAGGAVAAKVIARRDEAMVDA
ncbi:metallophosphoesterase (TIGR03767 family) [Marmoricola sp. OAE513]|uniref:TIGR03767 family metallophosphoesterase n=1 Tax=Marmoricola sp. OAE513 TaxID=2817894 RepID=UPI003396890A